MFANHIHAVLGAHTSHDELLHKMAQHWHQLKEMESFRAPSTQHSKVNWKPSTGMGQQSAVHLTSLGTDNGVYIHRQNMQLPFCSEQGGFSGWKAWQDPVRGHESGEDEFETWLRSLATDLDRQVAHAIAML